MIGCTSDGVNSDILSSGFRVPGSGFLVQGSKFRVPGSKFKVQSSGFLVPRSRFKVPGSKFKVPGSKSPAGARIANECFTESYNADAPLFSFGILGWVLGFIFLFLNRATNGLPP
jgi:hypothetical protein